MLNRKLQTNIFAIPKKSSTNMNMFYKKLSACLLTAAFVLNVNAQDQQSSLLTVAGDKISKAEFERVFYKNNNKENSNDEKSVREYLELYINYKLKVKEAESLKMDTVESFVSELTGYRKQLAQPYLTDKDVNENLVKEAYDRMQKDVRASHILIKLAQDALPKDTLVAYAKAMRIREKLLKGADFAKMAKDSSDDPSAKENGGDLGYFTGMQMVYPFENVCFNTKPGQIAMPVRTRFGYHVIRVEDVRPAVGEIHAAHIMIKSTATDPDSLEADAKRRINDIYAKVKAGEKWDDLVAQYSEDKGSAKTGGALPWFGTGRMVPEFEKAAFALKNDGDVSEPIQSSYGWHIIKRLEKRGIPTFEEKKTELKAAVQRDSRSEMGKTSLVNRIKKENMFKEVPKNKEMFIKSLDSTLVTGTYNDSTAAKMTQPLFTLGSRTYSQKDFASYLMKHQTKHLNGTSQSVAYSQYDQFVEESCIALEESQLDKKYPEFKSLMQEYRDGILLFDLTDKMVWSKAVKDSAGLAGFYDKNKNNYMWGERLDATIYSCANANIAGKVRKMVKKGTKDGDIAAEINKDSSLNVNIKTAMFSKGDNDIIDGIAWIPGITNDMSKTNQVVFVNVRSKMAPAPKSLEEAKGLITADYQTYLEKTWIEELRKKYPVSVDESVLSTVYKK
jgi:peptidyl-prolyl cis-trans isomerase SurA